MSDLHRAIAHNSALEAQARKHEQMLRESTERELARIDKELRSIPKGLTLTRPALATRYLQLVTDRAALLRHI